MGEEDLEVQAFHKGELRNLFALILFVEKVFFFLLLLKNWFLFSSLHHCNVTVLVFCFFFF